MSENTLSNVREKDSAVLACIRDGRTDTRQIRDATTLSNRDVNYCFDKLEELGLIETETPAGRITTVVDGQKRNFKRPRQATLTEQGVTYCAQADHRESMTQYEALTREELVEELHAHDRRIEQLETTVRLLRDQIHQALQRDDD